MPDSVAFALDIFDHFSPGDIIDYETSSRIWVVTNAVLFG
jgi:hypothetical protein